MKSHSVSESDVARTLKLDQSSKRGKRLRRRIVPIILVAALIVVVVIWRSAGKSDSIFYKTQEAQVGDLTVIVTATGNLEPTNEVEVGSELSGIIKTVEADYNDRVRVGQVLATLDTTKLKAQVMQSRAALEAAKAKVLQARATVKETRSKLKQLQTVRKLSNNKVPSQLEIDAAEAALDRAEADEAAAKASASQALGVLEANETDLSKTVIRSPINGIVLTRSVEPGQTVAASFQAPVLFSLAEDLTQMELHVDVDEADVGQVREGQTAEFSTDAYPGRTFEARITQVRYGSESTEGVVTYETVLEVNNSDLSLRPGMTATADITVNKVENALLVPNSALRFIPPAREEERPSRGLVGTLLPRPPRSSSKPREEQAKNKKQQRVWILKDGKPSAVAVTVGATNGIMSEVTAPEIKAGTALIVDYVETDK